MMDSSAIPPKLRIFVPLLLDVLIDSPIKRNNVTVPYEQVITELDADTVTKGRQIGFGGSTKYTCGSYANTISITLQVEVEKYERGVQWLREILYKTEFSVDRVKGTALRVLNEISHTKSNNKNVLHYIMQRMLFEDGKWRKVTLKT